MKVNGFSKILFQELHGVSWLYGESVKLGAWKKRLRSRLLPDRGKATVTPSLDGPRIDATGESKVVPCVLGALRITTDLTQNYSLANCHCRNFHPRCAPLLSFNRIIARPRRAKITIARVLKYMLSLGEWNSLYKHLAIKFNIANFKCINERLENFLLSLFYFQFHSQATRSASKI